MTPQENEISMEKNEEVNPESQEDIRKRPPLKGLLKSVKNSGSWAINSYQEKAPEAVGARMFHSHYQIPDEKERNVKKTNTQYEYEQFLYHIRRVTSELLEKSERSKNRSFKNYKKKNSEEEGTGSCKGEKCKTLNKTAKQKHRSYNTHKKLIPSATVLLLIEKLKKEKDRKNLSLGLSDHKLNLVLKEIENLSTTGRKIQKSEIDEVIRNSFREEEEREKARSRRAALTLKHQPVVKHQPMVEVIEHKKEKQEDLPPPEDFIQEKLKLLHSENEELRKKLVEMVEGKRKEAVLAEPPCENVKKKEKPSWPSVSSTFERLTKFCGKFSSKKKEKLKMSVKPHEQEKEVEKILECEELEQESTKDTGVQTNQQEHYKFLDTLMEQEHAEMNYQQRRSRN